MLNYYHIFKKNILFLYLYNYNVWCNLKNQKYYIFLNKIIKYLISNIYENTYKLMELYIYKKTWHEKLNQRKRDYYIINMVKIYALLF